jgi:endonuclease/exonuclease/phosphatase family metal-dependent hydrolase
VAGFVAHHRADPETSFPAVLTGDLNAVPTSDEVRLLTGEAAVPIPGLAFMDAWVHGGDGGPGVTWARANPWLAKARAPQRRIDYVLVGWPHDRGRGQVLSCRVAATEAVGGVQPSDHYAVVAELRTIEP